MRDRRAEKLLPVFGDIPQERPGLSKSSVLASLAAHSLFVLLLLGVRTVSVAPEPDRPRPVLLYTELAPPPQRITAPRPVPARTPPQPLVARRAMELPHFAAERVAPPARLPEAPPALAPVQQHVKITLPDSALAVIQPVKPPALPVQLGSFSTPVVEKTTLARTPAATGAFGGAANVAARPARDAVATGGFGEATASRTSRTGGAGTAGPGGFGDAVASAEPKEPGQVRAGGFQSAQAVETTKPSAQAVEQGPDSPVAILDKPRPGYTEEARQLKIEGEVLLEVCFGASGRVRVLRVIKGLGHGLDESAVRAAEAIRFRPASRKGTPVDATAEAHITFQLAY